MYRSINHFMTLAKAYHVHTHSINILEKNTFKDSELRAISKHLYFINTETVSFDINSYRNDSDKLAQENLAELESTESEAVQSVSNESKPSFLSMTDGDVACLEEQITKRYTT